jgi:hypothetical protein
MMQLITHKNRNNYYSDGKKKPRIKKEKIKKKKINVRNNKKSLYFVKNKNIIYISPILTFFIKDYLIQFFGKDVFNIIFEYSEKCVAEVELKHTKYVTVTINSLLKFEIYDDINQFREEPYIDNSTSNIFTCKYGRIELINMFSLFDKFILVKGNIFGNKSKTYISKYIFKKINEYCMFNSKKNMFEIFVNKSCLCRLIVKNVEQLKIIIEIFRILFEEKII